MQANLTQPHVFAPALGVPSSQSGMATLDRLYVVRPRRWLWVIAALYLVVAVRFAIQTPPWQAPDEPAHYNYIAHIAQNYSLPVLMMGDYDEKYKAVLVKAGFPTEMSIAPLRYESYQPPLYYLTATPFYWLSQGHLLWLRFYNVVLGLGVILLIYRCLETVFPHKPLINLGATAFAASLPMHVAVAAAVNNDVLAELWVVAALLALFQWMRSQFYNADPLDSGASHRQLVLLGVILGLGLLTKIYAYLLVPICALAIVGVVWRNQRTWHSVLQGISLALWTVIPALLLGLPLWLRNARLYGLPDLLGLAWHDKVVVGQARTADWLAQYGWEAYSERAFRLTFQSFWGVFGWLGVFMDQRIYTATLIFSGILFLGLLWALVRLISGTPDTDMDEFQQWVLGLLGIMLIAVVASYAWYNIKFVQHQGRYLFWGLLPIGTIVALGWREVMQPLQGAIAGFLALVLAVSLGLAGYIAGDINKWTLLTLFLIALFLLCQPVLLGGTEEYQNKWLPTRLRQTMARPGAVRILNMLRFCAWATPFALLFLLDFLIPALYLLPQLGYSWSALGG